MTSRMESTTGPDPIDHLLDASMPPTIADDALRAAIATMAADARAEVRGDDAVVSRRRKGVRVAVIGVVAAAIVGAGGVAVASSLISWDAELENPDTEFSVTLPSGRVCEARYVVEATYPDGGPEMPRVNSKIQAWLSAQDFKNVDLEPGERRVAQSDADWPEQTVVIAPNGWVIDVPEPPSVRTEDDTYAYVLSYSVREAITAGIAELGIDQQENWSIIGELKCERVAE